MHPRVDVSVSRLSAPFSVANTTPGLQKGWCIENLHVVPQWQTLWFFSREEVGPWGELWEDPGLSLNFTNSGSGTLDSAMKNL